MFVKRSRLTIRSAASVIFSALFFASAAAGDGVFRFPLFYVPTSLDPVKDELVDTYHITQQVYDGLVAFDANLRVVPGLAESWTVSRDGKHYMFELRRGVTYHNGREVTAKDVEASLTRLFERENVTSSKEFLSRIKGAGRYRDGQAEAVEGIRVLSEYRIAVDLVEPYAPFLSALAMPITKIVPRERIEGSEGSLGQNPVGTGPFKFESWEDDAITLKANREYFAGGPALDEIRFRLYPAEKRDDAFPDFLAGKLDGCPIPSSADLEQLRGRDFQVLVRPRLSLMFYGMNLRKPPMDNSGLRQSLMLALDRETLFTEVMGTRYPAARQILPPGMPGYSPDNALAVFDAERAGKILAESGYPGGKGIPEITIASASQSKLARNELALFRKNLQDLGIRLKPVFVETWEAFKKGIEEGKYHLYRYAIYADIPDPDDFIPAIVETGGSHNFTGYGNGELDSLLQEARGETDPIKRIELYRKAERMILADPPLIPVIFLSTQVAFQRNVRHIDLPATGTPYLPLHKVVVADGM